MSLFSPPNAPDPAATAAAQASYNKEAAISQAEVNNVNQSTPYGTLNYAQTGTAADGTPQFTATQTLSPAEQALFDSTTATQGTLANDANTLATNLGPSLTNAPNLNTDALTKQLLGWQQSYMQPIFDQQQSNLNSNLTNQGITQGSQAWNNAQNLQARNVDNSYQQAMAADQQQAYNQAVGQYQLPIQTLGTLLGEGTPASVNQSLTSTPQEQIQPPNYSGLVQQNYQNQLQQYGNTMSGLFGVGSALAGGWARSDRRLKRDIERIGKLDDGTPIYRFRYTDDPRVFMGLMAQDVMETRPEAVGFTPDGFMMVDYDRATSRKELAHV